MEGCPSCAKHNLNDTFRKAKTPVLKDSTPQEHKTQIYLDNIPIETKTQIYSDGPTPRVIHDLEIMNENKAYLQSKNYGTDKKTSESSTPWNKHYDENKIHYTTPPESEVKKKRNSKTKN